MEPGPDLDAQLPESTAAHLPPPTSYVVSFKRTSHTERRGSRSGRSGGSPANSVDPVDGLDTVSSIIALSSTSRTASSTPTRPDSVAATTISSTMVAPSKAGILHETLYEAMNPFALQLTSSSSTNATAPASHAGQPTASHSVDSVSLSLAQISVSQPHSRSLSPIPTEHLGEENEATPAGILSSLSSPVQVPSRRLSLRASDAGLLYRSGSLGAAAGRQDNASMKLPLPQQAKPSPTPPSPQSSRAYKPVNAAPSNGIVNKSSQDGSNLSEKSESSIRGVDPGVVAEGATLEGTHELDKNKRKKRSRPLGTQQCRQAYFCSNRLSCKVGKMLQSFQRARQMYGSMWAREFLPTIDITFFSPLFTL